MNIFIIGTVIVMVTLIVGVLLAATFVRLSMVVSTAATAVRQEKEAYNLNLTLGHAISVGSGVPEQLHEARTLAAKHAAVTPRGANMRIGGKGMENVQTARQGADHDPVTAVKIAAVHGWNLLHTQSPWLQPAGGAVAQTGGAVTSTKSIEDLVPGKDYPFIEVTDSMAPDEVRRARIANAKAKSAAVKALKEAGGTAAAPSGNGAASAPAAQPQAAAQPAAPAATGVVGAPVAGRDYEEIAITDDMAPDAIRKARIANAKAKAAAAKAMKASGATFQPVEPVPAPTAPEATSDTAAATEAPPAALAAAEKTTTAAPAGIPQPDYVEITDDMAPDEIRKARINNAKAKSAYQKALKAAGIDPATVEG